MERSKDSAANGDSFSKQSVDRGVTTKVAAGSTSKWVTRAASLTLALIAIQVAGSMIFQDQNLCEFPNVSFDDIAGHQAAKTKIAPYLETTLQVQMPIFMMIGPQGTGKKMMAKATASKLQLPLLPLDVYSLAMMSNRGKVQEAMDALRTAISRHGKLVLFLDIGITNLDRLHPHFTMSKVVMTSKQKPEAEKTSVIEILTLLMDEIKDSKHTVFVSSDKSVSGDFIPGAGHLVRLNFGFPTTDERRQILMKKLRFEVENDQVLDEIAKRFADNSHGLNGNHLAKICQRASLKAKVGGLEQLGLQHLEEAAEELEEDEECHRLLPWERQVVAFHEAGHVVSAWHSIGSEDVTEVSIVPGEDGALGFTKYASSGKVLHTDDMLLTKMLVAMAGQMTEKHVFGQLTTGARDDLHKMTMIGYLRVASFGFEDGFKASFGKQSALLRTYGDKVADAVDARVFELIEKVKEGAEVLVKKHLPEISRVAGSLLQKDALIKDDIEKLIGPRPNCSQTWPCRLSPTLGLTNTTIEEMKQLANVI